jgi:hypothetical protein
VQAWVGSLAWPLPNKLHSVGSVQERTCAVQPLVLHRRCARQPAEPADDRQDHAQREGCQAPCSSCTGAKDWPCCLPWLRS